MQTEAIENILVVDDEEAIREVVSTMLESRGYRCTAVSNGRAAQDQVKRTTPDLVLSDMIMPEMDGIKLLEWLRQYDPEVPVIMVTAIHDISTALEAIRRGAYDYILKPFEKDQLYLGVNRALQHRRLVAENRNYQRTLEQQVEERTARLKIALAQLEQSYDDTLEALGSALDLKDAETEGHCQRVTAFTISIARTMPVPNAYLPVLARAAFLHDCGKAINRELEGTHLEIGIDLLRKHGESEAVVMAMAAHHMDIDWPSLEAMIVQAADAISAARPGARRDILESYVKRLEKLESIADSFQGVSKAFALQAGREIRIVVESDRVSDEETVWLSKDIAKRIENELEYPGQIKVTVIRETRAVEYAR